MTLVMDVSDVEVRGKNGWGYQVSPLRLVWVRGLPWARVSRALRARVVVYIFVTWTGGDSDGECDE